jgi:hypothetical protein
VGRDKFSHLGLIKIKIESTAVRVCYIVIEQLCIVLKRACVRNNRAYNRKMSSYHEHLFFTFDPCDDPPTFAL